ncbi:MAG TPA: EAL domain-containing protein [Novosphingobium sp.]|nr:EAL domain-containing protein [Novosphingobium sp.]
MLGLQYARLGQVAAARLFVQALAALLTLRLCIGLVGPAVLSAWLGALAGCAMFMTRSDQALSTLAPHALRRGDARRHVLGMVVNGLLWSVPPLLFMAHADEMLRVEQWAVAALLMTGTAVIVPAVPLSTVLFCAILGSSTVLGLALHGDVGMAGLAGLFVLCVVLGAVEMGRHLVESRLAMDGMAERNEVVSLLLREYEETEADWLWQIDRRGRVCHANRRFATALGRPVEAVEDALLLPLLAGAAWPAALAEAGMGLLAQRLRARESFSEVEVQVRLGEEVRWWSLSGTPRHGDNGVFEGFRGVASDVTRQREHSDRIAWLARYDTLTGLPNRMLVTASLDVALAEAGRQERSCGFLMIDLDRFKTVNDTQGHHMGDRLLAQVARRLEALMERQDLCGRLGGDEFAVVLEEGVDEARVAQLAEAVIHHLSEPFCIDGQLLQVGASVGSAVGPRDGASVAELMRNADLALYRAKEQGRQQHHAFVPALHAQVEERHQMEKALRRALDRRELSLHFQPVVRANDTEIVSFEALLRWHNPQLGQVRPDQFIALAEETRLILPIGAWVLAEACRQAAGWPVPARVAVNVSGVQLLDPGFLETVVGALTASGLPAQRLDLEVTESVFLSEADTARAALEAVMALGCRVALDDFGVGYSALGYLHKLRFSAIKVDRSFVVGASAGNAESVAIIRAVVALAGSLGMVTTAEGVETADQLAMVRELGCTKIQGYLFGRPMPAAEVAGVLLSGVEARLAG